MQAMSVVGWAVNNLGEVSLGGSCVLCLLALLLHRLDDVYISGIVGDFSKLLDVLTELEEREVFPGEEDNLLSKVQSKIIKLVHMFKHKNDIVRQEQENIKHHLKE